MSAAPEQWDDVSVIDRPAGENPGKAFYEGLARAQGAFLAVKRDKTVTVRTKAGGTYSFSYAPLEAILRATLPSLNKEGFALVQRVEADHLVTTLYHFDGQISGSVKIMVIDGGPQAYGSALTYARRYGVTLLLGICADDDDDGNAAEGNTVEESVERARNPLDPEFQAKVKELIGSFQQADKVGIDGPIYEVHVKANEDSDVYRAAWGTLPSDMRARLKKAIARVKDASGQ